MSAANPKPMPTFAPLLMPLVGLTVVDVCAILVGVCDGKNDAFVFVGVMLGTL